MRINTDILSVFPNKAAEVNALNTYRHNFEGGGKVIATLTTTDEFAGDLEDDAQSLAEFLKEQQVASRCQWQPAWKEDPRALAELLAYFWINGDPQHVQQLAHSTKPEQIGSTISDAYEELANTMDTRELMLRSRDPLGMFTHPTFESFAGDRSENGFESENGRMHLILITPPEDVTDPKVWVTSLQEEVKAWQQARAQDAPPVEVGLTGGPVFAQEIASNIKHDMKGTVVLTAVCCSVLFWILLRRQKLLNWLTLMLGFILFLTVGIGSLVVGEFSIMSTGFASILIGLAVDYGMVICQEARIGCKSAKELRKAIAPGIIWAASTTAAVFASLCLSSLPGVRQLGALVAIGILVSAAVMLLFYLPAVAANPPASAAEGEISTTDRIHYTGKLKRFLPHASTAALVGLSLI